MTMTESTLTANSTVPNFAGKGEKLDVEKSNKYSFCRFVAFFLRLSCLTQLLLLAIPFISLAAEEMVDLLPPATCAADWTVEGLPVLYDRDTLSDRINGEAELYHPYGFERMAAARYVSGKNPVAGMDVEIYRMGSLLDAFGMFANYRQKDGSAPAIGTESNLSGSQIFFYQGRYFIHLQVTGSAIVDREALTTCARTVAARLPGSRYRPPELTVFNRSEVVKGSERYLPQSLLGYDFLNKGLMAEVVVGENELQIFLLVGSTVESASNSFARYQSLLTQGKVEPGMKSALFLEGIDPLYGPVIVLRKGACFSGVLKFSSKKGLHALLESVCR
jgi:hypothetical protein